jgi:hypothetical protein
MSAVSIMRYLLIGQFLIVVALYALMLGRLVRLIHQERKADRRRHRRVKGELRGRHPLMVRMLWGFALIIAAMLLSFTGISIVLIHYWSPALGPWRVPLWGLEALLAFLGILTFLRVEIKTDLIDLPVDIPRERV